MKISKKIILIWDFDGPVGQLNSSYPYNFNFENFETEIRNVRYLLGFLAKNKIKNCFAITGFSGERGAYPYNFPDLIKEISDLGHEVASHSWRHEWMPIFREKQIEKSLKRSKEILEQATGGKKVEGFVPPHNRPMSWIKRGAFSVGDRGLYPFFKNGDMSTVINLLKKQEYKWIRVTYNNIFHKIKLLNRYKTGLVKKINDILVFENHYTGFDEWVIDEILKSDREYYIISAHPLMLSFKGKKESKENFENFILKMMNSNQEIEFVLPQHIKL